MVADLLCWDDIDLEATETDDPLEQLRQDTYHRVIESRGENVDDPDAGLGAEDILSSALDPALKLRAENELKKDPRVVSVTADVVKVADESYRLDLDIETDSDHITLTVGGDS